MIFAAVAAFAQDIQEQGRTRMAEGETARAVESFEDAARANPFDSVALNNLAVAKAAQGDYQSALKLLERATRLAPDRADIAANLVSLRRRMAEQSHTVSSPRLQAAVPVEIPAPPPEPPALWSVSPNSPR
jgi:cytochrome c-type biogenesis protein CcmH/NrfG